MSATVRFRELESRRDAGMITEDEFAQKKAEILDPSN
jgi:hypothetical protein